MNYRHAFHAGNFADLVKHAGLLQLLSRMTGDGPLSVIDTHAGIGLYDLGGGRGLKTAHRVGYCARRDRPLLTKPAAV